MKRFRDSLTFAFLNAQYVELGRSAVAIARELGCNPSTVERALAARGIVRRDTQFQDGHEPAAGARNQKSSLVESLLTREVLLQHYVDWCQTIQVIAETFGCTRKAVRSRLRRFGIEPANNPRRPDPKKVRVDSVLTREVLIDHYLTQHKSTADIGKEFGCSRDTVAQRLDQEGIARRETQFTAGHVSIVPPEHRAIPSWKGQTKETNPIAAKISAAKKGIPKPGMRGPNHPNWKNGATAEAQLIRNSPAYAEWRTAVFQRDGYICQKCGTRSPDIEAHHVAPFAEHRELRLQVDNGVTLCRSCHRDEPRIYHAARGTPEHRQRLSENSKRLWQDPAFRAKMALRRKPKAH